MSTTWNPQTGEQRVEPQATSTAGAAPAKGHVHSTWNATIRTALGAAMAVTLILLAFAWPTYTSKVHHMPLGVVATDAQRDALQKQLDANGDPFTLTSYADRAAAVDAIEHRDVYGALLLPAAGSASTEVLTATAGSPAATQVITGLAQKMGAAQAQAAGAAKQKAATELAQLGAQAAAAKASAATLQRVADENPAAANSLQPRIDDATDKAQTLGTQLATRKAAMESAPTPKLTVTDVVPLASTDARGSGFAIAGLPLAMGGMIGGVMISTLVVGWKRRLVAIAGYGLLGGLGLALVLNVWFKFVPGHFATIWLVTGLAVAATASFIVGAQSLIGQLGIGVGAIATMFIGNPISSMSSPKEWLPGPWGAIGQWFVPGAAGNLMRVEAYFPKAHVAQSWAALLCWLGVGIALTLIGRHKNDEVIHLEGYVEPDEDTHATAPTAHAAPAGAMAHAAPAGATATATPAGAATKATPAEPAAKPATVPQSGQAQAPDAPIVPRRGIQI